MSKFHSFKSTSASTPASTDAVLAAITTNTACMLGTISSMHAAETSAIKEIALSAIQADPSNGAGVVAAYVEITRIRLEAEAAAAATAATFIGDLVEKVLPLASAVAEAEAMKARAAMATATAREKEADNRASFVEIEKLKAAVARREH
jgi:hypothetical protein